MHFVRTQNMWVIPFINTVYTNQTSFSNHLSHTFNVVRTALKNWDLLKCSEMFSNMMLAVDLHVGCRMGFVPAASQVLRRTGILSVTTKISVSLYKCPSVVTVAMEYIGG
ncbi:hypothetical protein XENOCAPTIV_009758 [Xenoophorus captivus]|uniref:Uncharacterized protein n=1 Tax=Xenoophorus captivus TaxID=1517983 RepID=A0ABV0RVU7_9TELE